MRLSVDLGPDVLHGTVAIFPDGTRIVFPMRGPDGQRCIATRLLGEAAAQILPGTQDGSDAFFSPDSQWVGFLADGKLKKIPVSGGTAVPLCDAPDGGANGIVRAAVSGPGRQVADFVRGRGASTLVRRWAASVLGSVGPEEPALHHGGGLHSEGRCLRCQ